MSLFRSKQGFTLIELLIVVVIIGILALAAIPLISAHLQEAKAAEAKAALGTIKDRLRTKFVQNNNAVNTSWTLADLVNTSELTGQFYGAADYSMPALAATTATFRASANTNTGAPQVTMSVTNIQAGQGQLTMP